MKISSSERKQIIKSYLSLPILYLEDVNKNKEFNKGARKYNITCVAYALLTGKCKAVYNTRDMKTVVYRLCFKNEVLNGNIVMSDNYEVSTFYEQEESVSVAFIDKMLDFHPNNMSFELYDLFTNYIQGIISSTVSNNNYTMSPEALSYLAVKQIKQSISTGVWNSLQGDCDEAKVLLWLKEREKVGLLRH